jgi:hypothetical protein
MSEEYQIVIGSADNKTSAEVRRNFIFDFTKIVSSRMLPQHAPFQRNNSG